MFEGVGVSLGSFTAGLLYGIYGPQTTFRIFGVTALILAVLHCGVQFIIKRFEGNTHNLERDIKK